MKKKPRFKWATGYIGGRLQGLQEAAYVKGGRWWTSDFKSLQQSINETFETVGERRECEEDREKQ